MSAAKKTVNKAAKKAVKKSGSKKKRGDPKKISSPFSTGGGGTHFEESIQASFVVLMLSNGFAPGLSTVWPIEKILLQAKHAGFETDDLVVFTKDPVSGMRRKLLGQVKHSLALTKSDATFQEVLEAAWDDYKSDEFDRGRHGDVIALITGPLSGVDIASVRPLLERARKVENTEEFLKGIELGEFTSNATRQKFGIFKAHLKTANLGVELSDTEIHFFLRSFHLLIYDLDIEAGVHSALLRTILYHSSTQSFSGVWERLLKEVSNYNQAAGTITREALPPDLVSMFAPPLAVSQPKDLAPEPSGSVLAWEDAQALSYAVLLGGWCDDYSGDKDVVESFLGDTHGALSSRLKSMLRGNSAEVVYKNQHWKVRDRNLLWKQVCASIDDDQLEAFQRVAIQVLSEIDPEVALTSEQRQDDFLDRERKDYSDVLKRSLAEGLNMIRHRSGDLVNCSDGKAVGIAVLSVRAILEVENGHIWGSLDRELPSLAEAAPEEFLLQLERALISNDELFIELFGQEDSGLFGRNYVTGVLWALETIAWYPDYFTRSLLCLAHIGALDPEGNWSNRPLSSLTTILLPWFPQTLATSDERKVTVQAIYQEQPEVGWDLLLSLLPNAHSTSSGSNKPVWLSLPSEEEQRGAINKTYWPEMQLYSDLAFKLATGDYDKLLRLLEDVQDLPTQVFDNMVDYLSSDGIRDLDEAKRLPIWDILAKVTLKHRRFSDADWAMDESYVEKLDRAADGLKPVSIRFRYQRYFVEDESDLYEYDGDWKEQRRALQETRNDGIQELLSAEGLQGVFEFSEEVKSRRSVGYALGVVMPIDQDTNILPGCLGKQNFEERQFVSGFINARQVTHGWGWTDGFDFDVWAARDIAEFFANLPFVEETWGRAERVLAGDVGLYWSNYYHHIPSAEKHFQFVAEQFMKHNRPLAAIETCFWQLHDKEPIDWELACDALDAAVNETDGFYRFDHHHVTEVIKSIQGDVNAGLDRIETVEWRYLQMIERGHKIRPISLERKIARDPNYFCELIRILYRPEGAKAPTKESSESEKRLASNVWHLFRNWKTPPGLMPDRSYSKETLDSWLADVLRQCRESGHLEVAKLKIGEVLTYCPPDPDDGLWIVCAAAEVLNMTDAEAMRSGFRTEIFNSRGVSRVVPSGQPEFELAEKWRLKSKEVRLAGYSRFAMTLKQLADSYESDAKRISSSGSLFDD